MTSFDNYLFRCSGLGNLMTESRTKSELISETTKKYLVECMIQKKYGRRKDIASLAMLKGTMVEEDSITLYSRVKKQMFTKNETRLENDFVIGTPDLFEGDDILRATKIIDIKSSVDIFTFWNAKQEEINKAYYWQLQGYMWLTGAQNAELAYCLVNTPETIIESQKRKLIWEAGIKGEDQYNHAAFAEIERLACYDDIALDERVFIKEIDRNNTDIDKLQERINQCRGYMNVKFN